MSKLYTFVFAMTLVMTARGGVVALYCGDCNGDGTVTVDEIISVAACSLGGPDAAQACPGTASSCPCPPCPFLATGQTISYVAGDDGSVQAGAPLRYHDNHDGTIADLNTGLMWEKKIKLDGVKDAANLHDADNCYPWSGTCNVGGALCGADTDCGANGPCNAGPDCQGGNLTIFKWVASLNAENSGAGFAGHNDWRIPNIRELQSIIDYGTPNNPTVSVAFNGASCGVGCTDLTNPACSCTQADHYWSATTLPIPPCCDLPLEAWNVGFDNGFVRVNARDYILYVRAVRGRL